MAEHKITAVEREVAESLGLDPQPDPIPNDRPSSHDRVIELLRARRDFGLRKYNTPLQAGNGRDHISDVIDELADAIVYLQTQKDELALARRQAWQEGFDAGKSRAMRAMSDEPHLSLYVPNPYPSPYEESR